MSHVVTVKMRMLPIIVPKYINRNSMACMTLYSHMSENLVSRNSVTMLELGILEEYAFDLQKQRHIFPKQHGESTGGEILAYVYLTTVLYLILFFVTHIGWE